MVSRSYCFTLNNYTDTEVSTLSGAQDPIKFICWGREVSKSGTPHLQGYVEFSKPIRMVGAKKLPGFGRASLHNRLGTRAQAIKYCGKDAPLESFGVCKGQGSRSDLLAVKEIIDDGGTLLDVADASFGTYLRYERGIRSYKRLKQQDRDWEMEVLVFWGVPGSGKSRKAYEYGDVYFVPTPRDGSAVWFDGYEGQETIVLDDFYGWLRWSFLLKLLDRYPMELPVKGGFERMRSRRVVITSNTNPSQWYDYDEKKQVSALKRRVTEVWHFTHDGSYLIPHKWE